MSDQVSSLFSLAHSLLTLGQDDRPIYVDDFTRLNRDVYESALNSYGKHGSTPEAEAELCLGLLVAFNAGKSSVSCPLKPSDSAPLC